jgi:hypothetical protein
MKPRIDPNFLHFANPHRTQLEDPQRSSANLRTLQPNRIGTVACAAMLALLTFGTTHLSAQQQAWPPDEPSNNGPYEQAAPQPYPPAQQNGYGQPQYPYPQQGYPAPAYQTPAPSYQGPGSSYQSAAPPYQGQASGYPQQGYGQQLAQMQPLSPDQLTQMVAPIALYPDALVAQILAASTYPAQVSAADQWLRSMGGAPLDQIAAGANAQSNWDPSVKALTAFPQVLSMLNRNLQWTTSLGNAYYNQPQDVLQTIQVMRQRAEEAGNLESTAQEQVSDNQGYIDIAPANPQVVYVPNYNPWDVYGQPVSPYPGFSLLGTIGSFIGSALVHYGPGIAMSAFMGTPFGWLGWGLDWLAHSILFNHGSYFTHSTSVADWGFPHGGPRFFPGRNWDRAGDREGWSHNGATSRAFNHEGNGFYRGGDQPVGRPTQSWGDARSAEGFNHGFPSRDPMTARPAMPTQQAYNHYPQSIGNRPQTFMPRTEPQRPDTFGRQGYAGGAYGQSRENSFGRSGMAYANPAPSYRAPENNYRGSNSGRSYEAFGGSAANSGRSGGFHLFGNHNSDQFGGRAPKAYSYSGGHSGFGGGRSFKAPKESHSLGGGGHFGGGGHSGGHSSGGHSGHHH